jgi:A/G-specific adenine glycosylase
MPKRSRSLSTLLDSDSGSSYDAEVVDSWSYRDDASKRKITSSKPRKKKKIQKVNASSSVTHEINVGSPPHSQSSHTIESSGPMRLALLEWYKTVHDIRGMPWRKPYDPNQGPDERARRAYEVMIFHIHEKVS